MSGIKTKQLSDSILIAVSGKTLGNTVSSFSSQVEAIKNRQALFSVFGDKTAYITPVVGGNNIINIDDKTPEQVDLLDADALITYSRGNILSLMAADCIPLVIYEPSQQLLALAHVGTSGAALHLPQKVIKALGREPKNLHCYIGPHIFKESYVFENLDQKELDSSWYKYIHKLDDGTHIDLTSYVLDELKFCGILESNIEINPIDTGSDLGYFSHRRTKRSGEPEGRNGFAVSLI